MHFIVYTSHTILLRHTYKWLANLRVSVCQCGRLFKWYNLNLMNITTLWNIYKKIRKKAWVIKGLSDVVCGIFPLYHQILVDNNQTTCLLFTRLHASFIRIKGEIKVVYHLSIHRKTIYLSCRRSRQPSILFSTFYKCLFLRFHKIAYCCLLNLLNCFVKMSHIRKLDPIDYSPCPCLNKPPLKRRRRKFRTPRRIKMLAEPKSITPRRVEIEVPPFKKDIEVVRDEPVSTRLLQLSIPKVR